MLSNSSELMRMFLYGIKKGDTTTVLPAKFVRIWNEWGMRDWMKSHGLFDNRIEQDDIIRDKFRNLIQIYFYTHISSYVRTFQIPDGVIKGYSYDEDPTTMTAMGTGGSVGDAIPPVLVPATMPKYLRHLSAMFMLNYSSYSSQECSLTGLSDWLDSEMIFADSEGVLRAAYYFRPSDSRLYHKIIGNKIYLLNGEESEPRWIRLEYIKYPNEMSYDIDEEEFSYDIDLSTDQLQEVVDSCVRVHLENIKSERYQSFLKEEEIRHQ